MEKFTFSPEEQPATQKNSNDYVEGDFSVVEEAKALGHASIGKQDNPPNPYRDPKDLFTTEDPEIL